MIRETEIAAASVLTPPANTKTLFLDSADGEFKTKDESGTVASLQGPQGDPGDPGADGADGADGQGVPTGGSTGQVLTKDSGTDFDTSWQTPSGGSGKIAQVVNTQTGAVASGTTAIPVDDTIPQNTEGDEYLTRAITPTSATNKLRIDVVLFVTSASSVKWLIAALFQDSTANALAVAAAFNYATGTAGSTITFSHYMTAGTTSATTFKVRAGTHDGNTMTVNGQSGGRLWGGVCVSSITITEIIP